MGHKEDKITNIRNRESLATKGPWEDKRNPERDGITTLWHVIGPDKFHVCGTGRDDVNGARDAKFIAHAREDVPLLLGLLEEQEARHLVEVSKLRRFISERVGLLMELDAALEGLEHQDVCKGPPGPRTACVCGLAEVRKLCKALASTEALASNRTQQPGIRAEEE